MPIYIGVGSLTSGVYIFNMACDPNTLLTSENICYDVYPYLINVLTNYLYSIALLDSMNSIVVFTESLSKHLIPLHISISLSLRSIYYYYIIIYNIY